MQPFLRGYAGAVTGLGGKAVFIGEFGCNRTDGDASYRGTLGGAERVIGGLNAGVRGFARWAYNHADSGKDDGFNPFVSVNGKLQPKPAVYYGYGVLTKAVKAGMQVATTEVQGGKDADGTQRVHAATLTGAGGVFTILLVNDGTQSKTIRLTGTQRPRLYPPSTTPPSQTASSAAQKSPSAKPPSSSNLTASTPLPPGPATA
jgi:hypothetical protein